MLLRLFDEAGDRVVYPRHELGIALAFRYQLKHEVRILRRRVAWRGDRLIGYAHTGGYRLLRKVGPLPDN